MIAQCLVDGGQYCFGHLLATVQIVIAIGQNFRLNNWHNTLRLANRSVTCQHVGILQDGLIAGSVLSDFQDATPLGKVTAVLLVLGTTGGQIVQTLGGAFVFGAHQIDNALVDLDAGNDAFLLENVNERCASIVFLVQRFVEEDDAGNVFGQFGIGAEQQLTVLTTQVIGIFAANVLVLRIFLISYFSDNIKLYFTLRREPIVPTDSSAAKIPLPGATMASAIRFSSVCNSLLG